MSVSTFQTLIEEAKAAIRTSDWGTAESRLMEAHADLLTLPNAESARGKVQWRQNQINELLRFVQGKKTEASVTASGGLQFSKFKRRPVGST